MFHPTCNFILNANFQAAREAEGKKKRKKAVARFDQHSTGGIKKLSLITITRHCLYYV